MKTYTYIILLICSSLVACNSKNGQVANPSDKSAPSTKPMPVSPDDPAQELVDTTTRSESTMEDPASILVKDPLEGVDTTVRPNPPHGEPGHRCDFPVGADISTATDNVGMSVCD